MHSLERMLGDDCDSLTVIPESRTPCATFWMLLRLVEANIWLSLTSAIVCGGKHTKFQATHTLHSHTIIINHAYFNKNKMRKLSRPRFRNEEAYIGCPSLLLRSTGNTVSLPPVIRLLLAESSFEDGPRCLGISLPFINSKSNGGPRKGPKGRSDSNQRFALILCSQVRRRSW